MNYYGGSLSGDFYAPNEAPIITSIIEEQAWCSTSHTSPGSSYGCVPTAGIAKPFTAKALAKFKAFQSSLNRLGASLKVDGYLGAGTLAAYKKYGGGPTVNNLDSLAQYVLNTGLVATLESKPAAPRKVIASGPVISDGAAAGLPPAESQIAGGFFGGFGLLTSGDVMGFVKTPIGMISVAGLGFMVYKIATSSKSRAPAPAAVLVSNPWPASRRRRRRSRRRSRR